MILLDSGRRVRLSFLSVVALLVAVRATAQDLDPRAYVPAPTGLTLAIGSVGFSSGDVLVDPTLPVEDVHATITSVTGGVAHTFGLFGRQAQALAAFPIVWLEASGRINEVGQSATRTGLGDPRLKLSVNFHGSPARTRAEFAKAPRSSVIIGASLIAVPPIGQNDETKLVNLGANRWSFKPELGLSFTRARWNFDVYTAVWLFTANDHFYPGRALRTQDPILAVQAHVSYNLRPAAWLAFDSTWYRGGQTKVNDTPKFDLQENSRLGATLSLPVGRRHALKFSGSTGMTTRIGGDFTSVGVSWQSLVF